MASNSDIMEHPRPRPLSHVFFLSFSLCLFLSGSVIRTNGLQVGINYGQIADNLPSPTQVASLLQSVQISRVKLYDSNPNILQAFSNSGIEFIIGLGNEYLQSMTDPVKAQSWVQQHVQPFVGATSITCITVGNEILTGNDTQLMSYLLPAMKNVYNALSQLGLAGNVTVSTAHSVGILGTSFPPSAGAFRPDLAEYIQPILTFHSQIKSPFLINAYPFFAYKGNPGQVPLDYVLFRPNQGTLDPITNLHYDNMLYAQIDAVYSAIKQMGHTDIEVQVSETGWPSKGDPDEIGASPENAAAYNGNLVERVEKKEGTPGKPTVPINVYVFALFNEDLKPGPASERNYGLYYPDERPVYNIGLQGNMPVLITSYTSSGFQRRVMDLYIFILVILLTIQIQY